MQSGSANISVQPQPPQPGAPVCITVSPAFPGQSITIEVRIGNGSWVRLQPSGETSPGSPVTVCFTYPQTDQGVSVSVTAGSNVTYVGI